MGMDVIHTIPSLKHLHILEAIFVRMLFSHNKTPKVFCLTFGVHVKSELPSLSESRKKESWEICLVQNVSPDGPLNGTFTVIPTRKKQSGGHPATRLLCSQAPPLPLGCSFWSLRGAIQAVFAPGEQSLGPPRGNFGLFCPWRAVFGATAGQIGPFLPLGGSLWRHCGAIWAFFAPGVQSLGPLRGNLGRFCPWGRFQKSQRHTAQRTTLPLKKNSPQANCHNWPRGL